MLLVKCIFCLRCILNPAKSSHLLYILYVHVHLHWTQLPPFKILHTGNFSNEFNRWTKGLFVSHKCRSQSMISMLIAYNVYQGTNGRSRIAIQIQVKQMDPNCLNRINHSAIPAINYADTISVSGRMGMISYFFGLNVHVYVAEHTACTEYRVVPKTLSLWLNAPSKIFPKPLPRVLDC